MAVGRASIGAAALLVTACSSFGTSDATPSSSEPDAAASDAGGPEGGAAPDAGPAVGGCPPGAFCDDFDHGDLGKWTIVGAPAIDTTTFFSPPGSLLVALSGAQSIETYVQVTRPVTRHIRVEARVDVAIEGGGDVDIIIISFAGSPQYEVSIVKTNAGPWSIEEFMGPSSVRPFEFTPAFGRFSQVALDVDVIAKTATATIDGVASQRALSPPRSFERASIQLGFPYAKGLSQAIYRVRFDDVVITSE